jgi:hypothetical protein
LSYEILNDGAGPFRFLAELPRTSFAP